MIELKLLTKMKLTNNEIEAYFKMVSFIKDYPSEFQFKIAVPHNWGVVPIIPDILDSQNSIVMIGKLTSCLSNKADITIWNTSLPREVNPSDWLESWVKTQKYNVHDSRTAATTFGLVTDLITTQIVDKKSYICRLTAIKDADKIFLLVARVATQYPDEFSPFQETFLMAVQTFKLLNPSKQKFAEAFGWIEFELPKKSQFLMPHSWKQEKMTDVPDGGEGIQFKHTLQNIVLGSIFVVSASKSFEGSTDIEDILISKIKNNNFSIRADSYRVTSKKNLSNNLKLVMGQRVLYKDKKSYVLMNASYESAKINIVIMLLSPDKKTHFDAWSINRRAFEILVNSVELSKSSIS
jgi:hypothetical protein